jgi:hypothetical protein
MILPESIGILPDLQSFETGSPLATCAINADTMLVKPKYANSFILFETVEISKPIHPISSAQLVQF